MNEITITNRELPTDVSELSRFVLIGRDALAAVRAQIRAIDKVNTASEVYKQKLGEAQEIAEVVLDAEVRLGELRKAVPKEKGSDRKSTSHRCEIDTPLKDFDEKAQLKKDEATHFETMASHPDIVEQTKAKARENGEIVTRKAVLDAIRESKRAENEERREKEREINAEKIKKLKTPLEAQGLFQTIVIDPPWDWGDEGDNDQFGRARPEYKTMPIEEIEKLPIAKIADKNCHLYLWVTNRSLPKAFHLLEAWGFRYVTCITWVKPSFGMGNYFRGDTEHVLFGVKGSQPLKRHDVGTHFEAPRGKEHSSKPDEFYALVESCSSGPYIDIFGRKERDGWDVWGENG